MDAGIDVIATKEQPYPQKMLIQAKRYGPNTTVGGPDIQQYASLKHQRDNVDSVVVVTSNKFTRHAEERAQELNVKTVGGNGLVELVNQLNSHDLLDRYDIAASASNSASRNKQTPTEPSTTDGSQSGIRSAIGGLLSNVSSDTYLKSIKAGTAWWVFFTIIANIGYTVGQGALGAIFALLAFGFWIWFPLALYYEPLRVARETDWTPKRKWYGIAGAIPGINVFTGILYLFRRKRAYGRAQPQTIDESSNPDTESPDEYHEPISDQTE